MRRRSLFTFKRRRGLRRSAQTTTRWPCPLRPERSARSFSQDWIDLIWQIYRSIYIDLDLKKNVINVTGLTLWLRVIASVHPVYAMNAEQRQTAADLCTKRTDLSHRPTCRLLWNYIHHRHWLLLSPKADTHFTFCPQAVTHSSITGPSVN